MKTIKKNNGLTIEQLEERFEMTVAECKSEKTEFCYTTDEGTYCDCIN